MAAKGNDPRPQNLNLTGEPLRSDLQVEASNRYLGKIKLASSVKSVSSAVTLLLILAGALATAYAVDSFAESAGLSPILTVCLALILAVAVFGTGIWFVLKTNQANEKGKKR